MAAVLLLVSGAAIAPLFAMAGASDLAGQAPAMPQTTVVLTPVADTTISGLEPETNLNSQHSLSVYWVDDSPDAPMRALIRFNLAAAVPPEAVIDSATLDLNLTAWENDGPVDVRARNVFSDWIESEVTWASRPEAGDPAMVTAVEAGEGRKTLDVIEIVQAWHNVPHYGLELSGPEGPPNYERSFDSRETDSPPELAVTYHVPPPPEYTFSGHAYLGEPPNRETPLDGAEVALYGDVDEWPGNGTGVYLAGAITERAGAFTLAWQGEPFPFYHVVNTGAPGTHVAGAQAEPPGTVTSASTVTYAELQPGEVGSIAFWNRPLPEGCQEWLRNGGFQRGSLLPWRSDGAAGLGSGREDEYGAWLGGQDSITAELFQLVTLPVGADPMLLTFWWMAESEIEQLGDVLRVLIQYDEQADRLLELPATGPRGEWRYAAVDLGAYAGRPIWVTFQAQTDAEVPTTFRVDDVSLLACGAEPPNLVVTDVWSQGSLPCYQIRNVGAGWAPGGHWTGLLIDGVQVAGEWVDLELEPGERWSHCFDYEWACTAPDDPVMAWADHGERVIEADEADNRREETWRCDTAPPTIVDGPAVSEITSSSALITWQTDEQSDGVVHYGTTAGRFPLEASDPTPLQSHAIPLTGLQPATVYRLKVRSTDAGGNSVESEERTFQTLPEADGQDPGVWLVDPGQWRDSVLVEAEASDNRGVEKVEFSLDGELVFIDYSPPYQFALDTALYENGQHGLAATAFDLSGRSDTDDLQADFANLVDQSAPAITITAPSQDETVSGKVNVVAQLSDDKGLAYAYFWVNGEFEAFEPLPSKPKNVTLTFEWDTTVMTQTKARLAVEAYDVEFKYGVATRDVIVSQPAPPLPPKLKVTQHKVTRSQNYVEVDLTVTNVGQGTAKNVTVQDFLRGFQPISDGTTAPSQVEYLAGFTASTRWWDCAIVDQGDLLAGASRTYRYTAIPVMVYPNPPVASVGEMVKLFYEDTGGKEYGETVKFPVSHTTANVPIATAHANALKSATYLLVTNPQRLFWYHVKAQQVDDLLSAMAELAYYKDGALGYLYTHDKYVLDALIEPLNPLLLGTYGDNWAFRLHPDFSKLLGGSVLIVGETEIVPAWEQGGFSIGWNPVKYSDQPYADTGGSPAPELLVGRIVGDSATTMIKPIQASIGVYTGASGYGFDHDRATLISGPGFGSFIQDVEDVAPILSNKGVAVSKAHNRDYFHISSFGRPFQEGDGFAVGDANGGADEIIVAEQSSDSIYVYRFDPVASAWTLLASFYGGYGGHEFEASDKIAAGDAMIVMADASADRILIYTGLGADSTSFPVTFDAGDGLALGDVTGDGNLEVVIADHSADKVLFYTPAGTKLANEVAYPLEAKDHLAVGDILGQGFAEEIVIADRSTNQILIYALNGTLQGSKQFGTVPVGGKTLNWLEYIDYDVSAQQDVGGSALAAGNLYPWPSGNNSGKEEILLVGCRHG
jgi:hypothetical protein